MVGLHYTFNADWGVDRSSVQYTTMMSAISSNYYNGSYGNTSNDESLRVYEQEFAYLVITANWGILADYCGDCSSEWTLNTASLIQSNMNSLYQMIQRTIPKIMVVPSQATL